MRPTWTTKEEFLAQLAKISNPLAGRMICFFLSQDPEVEGKARTMLLGMALGCSEKELTKAFEDLARLGFGELMEVV